MWDEASAVERFRVLRVAPIGIRGLFDLFVHPGVYESIGLPGWKTWRAVRSLPTRVALRHAATRPIVAALRDAGAVTTVPKVGATSRVSTTPAIRSRATSACPASRPPDALPCPIPARVAFT